MAKRQQFSVPESNPSETTDSLHAQVALMPSFRGAATIRDYDQTMGKLEIVNLNRHLNDQIKAVNEGKMEEVEGLLVAQAVTLDAIFHSLSRQAIAHTHNLDAIERLLRLGFRAQSQSRATLETLGKLKSPQPVAFVGQANITTGPQQVNNGIASACPFRVQENENTPNKLLEMQHGKRLDFGTTATTGAIDPELETLGTRHRSEIRGG